MTVSGLGGLGIAFGGVIVGMTQVRDAGKHRESVGETALPVALGGASALAGIAAFLKRGTTLGSLALLAGVGLLGATVAAARVSQTAAAGREAFQDGGAVAPETTTVSKPVRQPTSNPTPISQRAQQAFDSELVAYERPINSTVGGGTDPESFNRMINTDGPGWASSDGTFSIPIGDGRVLWLFGDTLMNTVQPDGSMHRNGDFIRNSAAVQTENTFTTLARGTASNPDDFLHPTQPDQWYWPASGIVEGDTITLFMHRLRKDGEGAWNFAGDGTDMLKLDRNTLGTVAKFDLGTRTVDDPGAAPIGWGTSIIEHNGHSYIYGMEDRKEQKNELGEVVVPAARFAYVARCPQGQIGSGDWEYWDGKGWSNDHQKAEPIADGVSNSFTVLKTPSGFSLVSQELYFSSGLASRSASSPEGPFSDWKHVHDGPPKRDDQISYNALVHPEFTVDGKLLVSWNMNLQSIGLPTPDTNHLYRPVFGAMDESEIE